jgi:hypothetical protein
LVLLNVAFLLPYPYHLEHFSLLAGVAALLALCVWLTGKIH